MGTTREVAEPLLHAVEASAWEDVEGNAENISSHCTVKKMFEQHRHDVMNFLQTSGVQKLAEFCADDDLVFGAFGENPILTFGSKNRYIDAETEWRREVDRVWRGRVRGLWSVTHPTADESPRNKGWSHDVSVEAFVVTIKNAAHPSSNGLIHPLIKQWQAKRCSFAVFSLPAVFSVILFKWNRFARRILYIELILYFIWMASYYTFCAAIEGEDLRMPLSELVSTARGRLTLTSELIAITAMLPFLFLKFGCIGAYGWEWLGDPSNIADLATYVLQIIITALHLGRVWLGSTMLTQLLCIQCILLMFRFQYFTQVLHPSRISFANVVKKVVKESGYVFGFIILTCVAYGAAFNMVFRTRTGKTTPKEYVSFTRSVLSALEHLYGDVELQPFTETENALFDTCLALSFIFIMGYCLINLLMGMIINSVDRVLENEDAKQLSYQAKIIDELEAIIPQFYERERKDWHPSYVHVLRINPEKLDAVDMDKLWSSHGNRIPVVERAHGSGGNGGRVEDSPHPDKNGKMTGESPSSSHNNNDINNMNALDLKKIMEKLQHVEDLLTPRQEVRQK